MANLAVRRIPVAPGESQVRSLAGEPGRPAAKREGRPGWSRPSHLQDSPPSDGGVPQ